MLADADAEAGTTPTPVPARPQHRGTRRALAVGAVMVCFGGIGLTAGGFGGLVWSGGRSQALNAPGLVINIDPAVGTFALTDTIGSIAPGQYRERLVAVGSSGQPLSNVRWSVSATVVSDSSPSASQPGDAVNAVAATTIFTSNANPALDVEGNEVVNQVAAGTGGLVAELWQCSAPNAWDATTNAIGAVDYWCDTATDGVRTPGWSQGALLSPANAIDLDTAPRPGGGAAVAGSIARGANVTLMLRLVFVPDVSTDGRQNSQLAEQISVRHRVDAEAAEGAF